MKPTLVEQQRAVKFAVKDLQRELNSKIYDEETRKFLEDQKAALEAAAETLSIVIKVVEAKKAFQDLTL